LIPFSQQEFKELLGTLQIPIPLTMDSIEVTMVCISTLLKKKIYFIMRIIPSHYEVSEKPKDKSCKKRVSSPEDTLFIL